MLTGACAVQGQGLIRNIGDRGFNRSGGSGGNDSLQRRDRYEDSITIRFKFLDSTRNYTLDSSIGEFRRFPVPYTYHYLGNVGTAAQSILFNPNRSAGFDPGFHAFDVYKWKLHQVRFYNTTRPYTELGYVIGSQAQQTIDIIHTQNLRPHWNAAIQYRLINTPGFFSNQQANHNNYLLTSWYQSPNKRYNNYFVLLANNLKSAENGGILTDQDYLNDPVFDDRMGVPTKIGPSANASRNPFDVPLTTGNNYKEFNGLLRQQYDIGRKDSIVTDSTVIPLFFPRLRFEHTLKNGSYKYQFVDNVADSAFYKNYYDTALRKAIDTFIVADRWKEWSNDFSIYTFPDANNQQQFLKLGAELQLITGNLRSGSETFSNVIAHGEYRNRTRNQKWDMQAFGRLYAAGYNAGDYHAFVSLQRLISNKIGSLQIGFENINRSPAFLTDRRSSFYLDEPKSLNKENVSHLFAKAINPALQLELGADYYLLGNYIYYKGHYQVMQESALFNVLRVNASKTFNLSRHLKWYAEATVQQKTGTAELNLPLFFTRNRIAFEGNFFRNLFLSTGLEMRYHTPYRQDNYSPVLGQFSFQDSIRINNRPDVHAFFNFRIRGFKAYIRAENLNTLDEGFSFQRHNFGAPDYPYPGLVLRFGIYWSFVN